MTNRTGLFTDNRTAAEKATKAYRQDCADRNAAESHRNWGF